MLTPHPSWYIIDSTKLQDYERCPRYFLYRHILGWEFEEPNIHLIFGTAWHIAMEILLKHGYGKDSVDYAAAELTKEYRRHFMPTVDDLYYPKTPAFAREMLQKYVKKFPLDHNDHEVLYTEVSGSVPIGDSKIIHFKTDSILQGRNNAYHNKVLSREHKTASRRGNKWALKIQVGTYNHVLYCLFGPEYVYGVEISEAFFQKSNPDFLRTTITKDPMKMQDWLWTTTQYYDSLMLDIEHLLSSRDTDPILECFPKRESGCSSWGGCEYYDFCVSWSNPLQRCEVPPMGMIERFWDPREQETTMKMDLGTVKQETSKKEVKSIKVYPLHIETIRR